MKNFLTFKQLLQMDRKTVLQYQLLFNYSLQDFHPLDTIEYLKSEIQKYPNNKIRNKDYITFVNIDPKYINSIEDVYKYKEVKILKSYKDNNRTEYYLYDNINNLISNIYESKENFVLALEEQIKEKEGIIELIISLSHSENNRFSITLNRPRKTYMENIKNNVKTLLLYQMKTKLPITKIVESNDQVSYMRRFVEHKLGKVNYSRKIEDIKTLDYINYENINNYKFAIIISTKWGKEISYNEFENVIEFKDFINDFQYKYNIRFKKYDINYMKFDKCISYDEEIEESVTIEIHIELDRDECEKIEFDEYQHYIDISEMETIHAFNKYKFTHGLQAYYGHRQPFKESVETLINRNDIYISCSYKYAHIGSIGVYLEGDCKFASHFDVNSICDRKTGKRFIRDEINEDYIIKSPKEIIYIKMAGEAIVTNFKIVGIWARKGRYDEEQLNILKELTGISNVEIIK